MDAADRIAKLLEDLLDDRQVLAVSPAEAGRRLCGDKPLSADVVTRMVEEGVLARLPHTARVLIPVSELKRFVETATIRRGRAA